MTPFEILNEVKRRSAEAVIAQSGLAHEGLRRHLRAMLVGDDPGNGAMLQEPVLEGAHPFVTADATMAALAGSLLHADLVAALDGLPADHDYRFPLGIARLRNPSIDRLGDQLPGPFRRRGKIIDDWRTYLDAVLTWFVRGGSIPRSSTSHPTISAEP